MQERKASAPADTTSGVRDVAAVTNQIVGEINGQIAELEGEDWHDDDRSRRATINGLNIALRIVEKAAAR